MDNVLVLEQSDDADIRIYYSKLTRCFVFEQEDNQIILTFEEMDHLMEFAGEFR